MPLDLKLFKNPPARFRGAPFWSWNSRLDVKRLIRQIDNLREMGFGGFHIHARTGLESEYLGKDFMAAVKRCVAHAKKRGMLAWLYDEDRWPSGFGGGIVTRDSKYRARQLRWTRSATNDRPGATLLAAYSIALTAPSDPKPVDWYAWLEALPEESWFNNQTNVDTMNAAAVRRFIQVTHEAYKSAVGGEFGKTIPAIFTDEPQFLKKQTFQRPLDGGDVLLPWSDDFVQTYRDAYDDDLLDHLPDLFWDRADGAHVLARYRYHDHTAERFASAFGDQIAAWCAKNKIALTGHMLSEATLFGQTRAVGEVMRAMRSFQIPGIDMLEDKIELTTAKQAQSLARQFNRQGVMSELYGVTNWDFDFAGHKRQGDWQAALGVTVRVPHLAWVSMAGEAKRDYPAAIDYHSPWYREYPLIENHFARLHAVLTRGRPLVRVGVIHPIESFWLCFGTVEQSSREREQRETEFADITKWLAFGLLDFDYISEAVLASPPTGTPGRGRKQDRTRMARSRTSHSTLRAAPSLGTGRGRMYDAIIVPGLRTVRSTTLQRLAEFSDVGGVVIFAGEIPTLVDAQPSPGAARLADRSVRIPFARRDILGALEPFREIDVRQNDGGPVNSIVHQIRVDGNRRYVFLANTSREQQVWSGQIRLRGKWNVTELDTMAGTARAMQCQLSGGDTILARTVPAHGHLLLQLAPRKKQDSIAQPKSAKWNEIGRLDGAALVTLSEPNVLLLDQAEWRLDAGQWRPRDEILRIDNAVRRKLGLALRGGRIPQPWTDPEPAHGIARIQLRFRVETEILVVAPLLALEEAEHISIAVDGRSINTKIAGWWVDESIKTVRIPDLPAGAHELVLTIPFSRKTNLEWCYLLGDFGVRVAGATARITAPVRELEFGDWTHQGLPFYAGNVTYHCQVRGGGRPMMIEAWKFKNPLLSVALDGAPAGKIAFAPHQLELGKLKGRHRVDITAYGNRANAFGPLHHTNERLTWIGPAAWRSEGKDWSYEYNLKRMGILASPIVYERL